MRHGMRRRVPRWVVWTVTASAGFAAFGWYTTIGSDPTGPQTPTEAPSWTSTAAPGDASDSTAVRTSAPGGVVPHVKASPKATKRPTATSSRTTVPSPATTRPPTPHVTTSSPPAPSPTATPATSTEAQVVALMNAQRAKAGLKALSYGYPGLSAFAQEWAEHMASTGQMVHHDSIAPYKGEVIAYGYATPAAVVDAWMKSPPHKAIILDPTLTAVGIGRSGTYWCADFS